jgi:hypothetical protein
VPAAGTEIGFAISVREAELVNSGCRGLRFCVQREEHERRRHEAGGGDKMLKLTFAVMAVLMMTVSSPAAQASDVSSKALEVLLHAEQVDDAAVGVAGSRSERYDAFADLWNEGDSVRESIDRLIDKGTPAGRIYGLILLRNLDSDAAARAARDLKGVGGEVNVLRGCLMMKHPFADLAELIASGGHVITAPVLY